MDWKLTKKVNVTAVLFLFFMFALPILNVYADVKAVADTSVDTALTILYGPVAKIAAAICAVLLFVKLIQRDIAAVAFLLAAAIILFKLQDIVGMLTGK